MMKRNKNRLLKACGVLALGGVVMQFGGCGTLVPQIGSGFTFAIGAIPAQVVGCVAVEGAGQSCDGLVLPGAIILGD